MSIFTKLKSKKSVQKQSDQSKTPASVVDVGTEKQSPRQSALARPSFSSEKFGRVNPRQSASLVKQVWITERAVDLSHLRQYTFVVAQKANKPEIKKAIEAIYNVKVDSVNIINTKSKPRRLGRSMGRTSQLKKAIVKLKEGYSIDVMPT